VVVDTPCTVTLVQTQDLLLLAQQQGRVLTVFQNRRWDADFLSLQAVLATGVLGRIVHFESHFDRYRPVVPNRWREQDLPGSGLWFDLGSHLVDQCLQLLGLPDELLLDLACQRDGAQVNDYFHATLRYGSRHPGLRAILHGSTLVPELGPRFVVHGTKGSFVKYGLDVQEDALKAGLMPITTTLPSDQTSHTSPPEWGHDPAPGRITVPTEQGPQVTLAAQPAGNYLAFYAQLAAHLQGREAAAAVAPDQVEQAMRILTLGEHSAAQGRFVVV
jgi:predicted dehydrogenase